MACFINVCFRGSKVEVKNLHSLLKNWTSKNYTHSMLGKSALDNVVWGAKLNRNQYTVKGVIDMIDFIQCYEEPEDGHFFMMNYKTEKGVMPGLWYAIVKRYAPHCKVYWFAMDSANNFYMTNDRNHVFFAFDYFVECNVHKENPLYYLFLREDTVSEMELLIQLSKVCGGKPIKELIKQANSMMLKEDETFCIHKIRVST